MALVLLAATTTTSAKPKSIGLISPVFNGGVAAPPAAANMATVRKRGSYSSDDGFPAVLTIKTTKANHASRVVFSLQSWLGSEALRSAR